VCHDSILPSKRWSLHKTQGESLERSYLRFDVTQLTGSVTKATLRLYADNRDRFGYTVRSVASTDWSEGGITYTNADFHATGSGQGRLS
jgi:hypothetical protein